MSAKAVSGSILSSPVTTKSHGAPVLDTGVVASDSCTLAPFPGKPEDAEKGFAEFPKTPPGGKKPGGLLPNGPDPPEPPLLPNASLKESGHYKETW